MAADEKRQRQHELYNRLNSNSHKLRLYPSRLAKPDPTIESEKTALYLQARKHRNILLYFYIVYTSLFTVLVLALVIIQFFVRLNSDDHSFQVMPEWTLNIIVGGMFGQFLVLLKIVTDRVWDFRSLLDYHNKQESGIEVSKINEKTLD